MRVLVEISSREKREMVLPPSEQVVYRITFSVYALVGLTALEIIHMLCFGSWNSEIFSAITGGLIGTITGILLSQRA